MRAGQRLPNSGPGAAATTQKINWPLPAPLARLEPYQYPVEIGAPLRELAPSSIAADERCRRSSALRAAWEIDVGRKVAFLGLPQTMASDRPVETIETHFSWVFLTDRYVYKLKKPLRGDGFDFDSMKPGAQFRRRRCGSIAAWPPTSILGSCHWLGSGHGLAIGGQGFVVDWLVKMVRLPAERMLDRRLLRGLAL